MADKKDTNRSPAPGPPSSGGRAKGRRKGRSRRPAARGAEDLVPRLQRLLTELDQVGAHVLRDAQALAPEAILEELRVPLLLSLNGQDREERARDLLRSLRQEARESLLSSAAFQRGRVYCLRCENSICEHATPPGPRHVFQGYGQTGRPEWSVFEQLLSARGDPRRNLLYEVHRPLLTLAMPRAEIYQRLLPGFEEAQRRYLVLAQMCVGYFRPQGSPSQGESMALTVQVIRGSGAGGQSVVAVNLVGQPPKEGGPERVVDDSLLEGLEGALVPLRRELGPFARTQQGRRKPVPGTGIALERLSRRCLSLVRDACRDLEHRRRADSRRTRHARERSTQGDRPTAKALEDARSEDPKRFLQDRQNDTVVVLGQRGRVHVFTLQGRHVTSAVYTGTDIKARRERKRWVPLAEEALARFRAALGSGRP